MCVMADLQAKLDAAEARIAELEAALGMAEDALDRNNTFPCMYCLANTYDGLHGIVHNPHCLILELRAALEAPDA
jgi:hypothetical protein